MSHIIHTQSGSITAVAGTISANLIVRNSLLNKIFVKATTANTTFDIKLTDIYSNDVLARTNNTGELNEVDVREPAYGNFTFTIENASADEAFTYLFAFEDK